MKEYPPSEIPLIRHFTFEAEGWSRLLVFYKEELVACKNRLAELLADTNDDESLQVAEGFQEDFVSQDIVMRYLDGELKKQVKLLARDDGYVEEKLKEAELAQKKLQVEIKKTEALFKRIKEQFDEYCSHRF